MDLVVDNPFRVLGLPATATSRDIAKRVSDLETFAELGKAKTYALDLPSFGPLDRSVEGIRVAAQRIEQAESKLFHSFFWFRTEHEVDEEALAALARGDVAAGQRLWDEELAKGGAQRYSTRLNRAVLNLRLATNAGLDAKAFKRALSDIGFLVDDYFSRVVQDVLGSSTGGVNQQALARRVVDSLVRVAKEAPGTPFGANQVELPAAFSTFSEDAQDYARAKVANPLTEKVEEAIAASARLREAVPTSRSLASANGLLDSEESLRQVTSMLNELAGGDDAAAQSIINRFAEEVCECAIKLHNDHDGSEGAVSLLDRALAYGCDGQVKSRIEKNKEAIEDVLKDQKASALFEELSAAIEPAIGSVHEASKRLTTLKSKLAPIRGLLGRDDPNYVQVSSVCVGRILGFVIDTVNEAQKEPARFVGGISALANLFDEATSLTKSLQFMDMDAETRARVSKNLEIIQSIQVRAAVVRAQVQAQQDRGLLEQIPGWLWLVGGVLLLAMCSGK